MNRRNMTNTLEAARAHARSQAAPATDGELPDGVLWDVVLPGGGSAGRVLRRDTVLRLTDVDGDACVQLLAYVADRPWERLNVADTVKVQWQAYLGPGSLLLSDMGRVLLTLVGDTSSRHDCLCGGTTRRANEARYGDGSLSGPTPSARDLLAVAAAKQGLARVDVASPVNLFKGARVADDGALSFDGSPVPGTVVELRAELDVIVLLANAPHPLDDRPDYTATPVRATARRESRPPDDPLRTATPERARAFRNTDDLLRSAP